MSEAIVYRYVAEDGSYHTGIPARDLTSDDMDALTDEQREVVAASPVYAGARTKAAREAVAARPEPEPEAEAVAPAPVVSEGNS